LRFGLQENAAVAIADPHSSGCPWQQSSVRKANKKGQQSPHRIDLHGVADEAALARGGKEPGAVKFLQMKGCARRTDADSLRYRAGP
jgi:hypothetical protein